MRRAGLLIPLVALLAAGCGGTPNAEQKRRAEFLLRQDIRSLKDPQLARLCPSLYPRDYLRRPKHYHYSAKDRRVRFDAAQRAAAKAAGCTNQGTEPE